MFVQYVYSFICLNTSYIIYDREDPKIKIGQISSFAVALNMYGIKVEFCYTFDFSGMEKWTSKKISNGKLDW